MRPEELWAENLKALGGFIRQQRSVAEMSQRELAKLANLSDTYMSQLERGLHEPSIRVLRSIAEGLNLSAEQLISFVAGLDPEAPRRPRARPEDAIRDDDRLTDDQKQALLAVLDSYVKSNDR